MAKEQKDVLHALLSADKEITSEVNLKRLGTVVIKAIDGNTLNKLTEEATHYVGKDMKKKVDETQLGSLIIAKSCIKPDFSNDKLLEKYDASDAGDCVQKSLLAGEIAKLNAKIFEISGFAEDEEDIKN